MATIRKKGESWHVQIRRKHVTETKTFTTKQDASAWARLIESEIDRGVFVSRTESENTTFEMACSRYEEEVVPRLKGAAADRSRLKTLKIELGKLPLAAINSSRLARFRDERLYVVSKQTVIHELGLINRVLKTCVIDWGISLPAGVPLVRKPSAPPGRSRRVSDEEISAIILATKSPELEAVIQLAIETAMRRSELSGLTWDAVNFKTPAIVLKDGETKNGEGRAIPLSLSAIKVLKSLPRRIDGQVFGMQPDSITQAFERSVLRAREMYEEECKEKGIDPDKTYLIDMRLHDLRHEAISRIAPKVKDIIQLSHISGHRDLAMLKRYYHSKVEDLAKMLG